jgi:CBS domain-containing protein
MGRLRDVVIRVAGADPPEVVGVLFGRRAADLFLPISHIENLPEGRAEAPEGDAHEFIRQPQSLLLCREVMDHQVIDLRQVRVVRVNDVLLQRSDASWRVEAVDLGAGALLRRLLPRALRPRAGAARVLRWSDLELFAGEASGSDVQAIHVRLSHLHPVDIARVADAVPTRQALEIVASLSDDLAADTMEEMIDEKQADVIEELDTGRAARILDRMAPDAAADVLAELEPEIVDALLRHMEPAEAADVHALLTYPKDSAGGLMTTGYVIVQPDLDVRQALAYLRPQLAKPDWIYYIYVVSDVRERHLEGVLSLRDLLLAPAERRIGEIMTAPPRQVSPDTPAPRVAQIMAEYNLVALPVTDRQGRLLGIVSVDDALESTLPPELRRQLPRVFS